MNEPPQILIVIGCLLLIGLATDSLGRYTHLPRVTLLLLFGFFIRLGYGFVVHLSGNQLPSISSEQWSGLIADMALVMVGFLLGEHFSLSELRMHGLQVLALSVGVVVVTALVVTLGLTLLGVPFSVALILGAVSTATAPAATMQVVRDARADGPFSRLLLGIVAIDDAWGLMLFSVALTAAAVLQDGSATGTTLVAGVWEVAGAVLLGILLGVPAAYLTGRLEPGEPTLTEALGVVFLCGGLALLLKVSFLLAAMVLGATVANLARHHKRPFHAIEQIEWPFMVLFFVFAGASLDPASLLTIGLVGSGYVVFRIVGRLVGAWIGARLCAADGAVRRWMGVALLPQAGVALGMALIASSRYPEIGQAILPVVVSSTVLFEIVGPILTKLALVQVGEASQER